MQIGREWKWGHITVVKIAFLLTMMGLLFCPSIVEASHFRYGTISWAPTGTAGEVEFKIKAGRSGSQSLGGTFNFNDFDFGDGTSRSPNTLTVTASSATENWRIGEATFRHTYSGAGPFTAGISSCCRISPLNNRDDGDYIFQTTVSP